MNISINNKIKNDHNSLKYLRSHSYWYKYLNRKDSYFNIFYEEMKKAYKITPEDKMNNIRTRLDDLSKILDIFN